MKTMPLIMAILALAVLPASAVSLYVVPDVPTDLGGTMYLPSQILRYNTPVYSLALDLPAGTPINGLHRLVGGDWLISVSAPTDLGGTTYLPNDVVRTNGGLFSSFFCGNLVGVPIASNVDAVVLDVAGNLALSFDVPTTIGASTFESSDLVRFNHTGAGCGSWSVGGIVFDASAATPAVPISSNVTAADARPGRTILSWDVPTTLGGSTILPGDLETWNGAAFGPFETMAGWPVSSYVNAISFLIAPGTVPVTMQVQRIAINGSLLRIAWSPGCSAGDEDYGIYEGALGSWYSHARVDCSDEFHDFTEDIGTTSGNRYYLVVSNNPNDEGSYGSDSGGGQRPAGALACVATQAIACP